jgi:hypothetical protein
MLAGELTTMRAKLQANKTTEMSKSELQDLSLLGFHLPLPSLSLCRGVIWAESTNPNYTSSCDRLYCKGR